MAEYGQFCPVAKAAEIFAERWTPLVIRELLCGSTRYSDIRRGVPLMSPSLLSKRLQELEHSGIVERRPGTGKTAEYHLTEAGEQLRPVVMMLGEWGQRWSKGRIRPGDYDPTLLMWDMHRRIRHEALPAGRTVISFRFADAPPGKRDYWLVLNSGDADICLNDPGYEVDVHVSCPLRVMVDIWMGDADFLHAIKTRTLEAHGPRELVRAFPGWFELSLFAPMGELGRARAAAKSKTA